MKYVPKVKNPEVANRIGHYVSQLVDDGATLQIGFGSLPYAILECLEDKHDLGLHTQLITEGFMFYSGIGDQVDFLRGSSMSRGGFSIIALPSTAKNGKVSRIVPNLSLGAGVAMARGMSTTSSPNTGLLNYTARGYTNG